jgi:two-component system, OmpR family, response regulator
MAKKRVMVVDDEELWSDLLKSWLQGAGYTVVTASSGAQALQMAVKDPPDCILLDFILPDKNGSEVTRLLRAAPSCRTVPIVLLTVHQKEKISGLQSGADYFVQKAERPDEILAILHAMFRRRQMDLGILSNGDLTLHPKERAVSMDERPLTALSPKTFDLFYILVQRSPVPVSKEELFKTLEGRDDIGVSRALDLLLNRLRKAIGEGLAERIKSVKGYGYVYIPPSKSPSN